MVILQHEDEAAKHYLNFVYQPIRSADGKTISILIVTNDVTE